MDISRAHQRRDTSGFTLIELLTVIVVIAILAALVLPALSQAKNRVQTMACINNLRQLESSCHLYSTDYADYLPPNNPVKTTIINVNNAQAMVQTITLDSWCPGLAPVDQTSLYLSEGLIYPYNRSPFIYHCPADQSVVAGTTGTLRTRSYSMDVSLNSDKPVTTYEKYTDIKQQSTSDLFSLIDAHPQDIQDATFDIESMDSDSSDYWLNLPADRHAQGANLTFADGHAEYWKWKAPKVYLGDDMPAYSTADLEDLVRLEGHAKPGVN